ncbi:MAG: bifunctional phosphopantothenoylcysteine decarboxylase/phosphopantothenate--cysteine ligase CoaBC [Bacteroidota bacterium]|nr:bifunctional phosphopantothenoylcysteine decarboxylase/phosphopantothenate--cysteine ligase CoaBC [Bacteroidota bacterium]
MLKGKKILYCITGSIAAAKAPIVARELIRSGADVHCVLTNSAQKFTTAYSLSILTGHEAITDIFSSSSNTTWHVHLARSADAMLIGPCSAATLGKLRSGIYDNPVLLLASSLPEGTPLVIAPAMDEEMWLQPAVQENIAWLKSKGVQFIEPVKGALASGLTGFGRMPEPDEVVKKFEALLKAPAPRAAKPRPLPLGGKRILITAGPTYEPIDAVRFIGNRSSGKMGAALAAEASLVFGADVTLIMGPSAVATPSSVHRIDVETADQMRDAVLAQLPGHDILIMNAAVSDFRPTDPSKAKIKKSQQPNWKLDLAPTRDILKDVMASRKPKQHIIGFALEGGDDATSYAKGKLEEKGLDMIVLNRFDQKGSGFSSDTNRMTIFTKSGLQKEVPLASKTECARIILSLIAEID